MGTGTREQRENARIRSMMVAQDHQQQARDEEKRRASDEASMQEMHARIQDPSRVIPGSVKGGVADPLSGAAIADSALARSGVVPEEDVPHVPMAL